jgi:threonine/homoserine/homoserine lactone efflux protein
MTPEFFFAMASFAFVMAFTPGPNNVMLTASAANFGFVPSIPHMLGVTLGFVVLVAASGAGLGTLFVAVPAIQTVLKIVGR